MAVSVALIDYGSGNLRSAEKALTRVGASASVTADPETVAKAERVVLPGVGAFADCMAGLRAIPGMIEALEEAVLRRGAPFLGICVGMQLLASVGREFGDHKGLGWIEGEVVRLAPSDGTLKIPHMGWNALSISRPHPVLTGIAPDADVYFVHSYAMHPAQPAHTLATCDYGGTFTAVAGRDNILGTQFHPEKSQAVGLALLRNFLKWRP
ncbi:MAG TPA: imidazole glycerol phosphate synthase subunit HisH [Rhizomicrobium sp.]|nr:imidazole glycerol phosphate synthase subunit HisH [Rhizomicrobium sp.]